MSSVHTYPSPSDNGHKAAPFAPPVSRSFGPEAEVEGKRVIVVGSNDFLGLTHDTRVLEAASNAVRRWGAGPGGSRFLSGNMTLHEQLEERLADFLGKRRAVVHTTGYLTNYGVISTLVSPGDVIVADSENRGSVQDGCRVSQALHYPYAHNDPEDALAQLNKAAQDNPGIDMYLVTQGVFGLTGNVVTALPELAALKANRPEMTLYLDDSYGLGVMGASGRGTADAMGVGDQVDYIMGTFSKSLASIGGFVASNDETIMDYIRHSSKSLIFSAALPAMNAAAVLACLDIVAAEPDRMHRLWELTNQAKKRLDEMGLVTGQDGSPVISVLVGEEAKADALVRDLFARGVYTQPVLYPVMPKSRALLRLTFMATHEDGHVNAVLEALEELAEKHAIRAKDLGPEQSRPFLVNPADSTFPASTGCASS